MRKLVGRVCHHPHPSLSLRTQGPGAARALTVGVPTLMVSTRDGKWLRDMVDNGGAIVSMYSAFCGVLCLPCANLSNSCIAVAHTCVRGVSVWVGGCFIRSPFSSCQHIQAVLQSWHRFQRRHVFIALRACGWTPSQSWRFATPFARHSRTLLGRRGDGKAHQHHRAYLHTIACVCECV